MQQAYQYNPALLQAPQSPGFIPVPPVVGQEYCAPYAIDLTVVKKVFSFSGGDFLISDSNGNVMFRVDGRAFSITHERTILDAKGAPLLCARRRLMTLHNRWVVYRGMKFDSANELFTVKKSAFLQLKTSLDIFLASNTRQEEPDFKVKGNYFERHCTVFHGAQTIAQVKRKLTASNVFMGKDTFVITVFPGMDHAFIASLIVIMDEIYRDD